MRASFVLALLLALPALGCGSSSPIDINYGTDAGADFDAPAREVHPGGGAGGQGGAAGTSGSAGGQSVTGLGGSAGQSGSGGSAGEAGSSAGTGGIAGTSS
jgi:hypothetical protein